MNIHDNILQAVADAAFEYIKGGTYGSLVTNNTQYPNDWDKEAPARRAVIQHALANPALAPFLAGAVGEYTDGEILNAYAQVMASNPPLQTMHLRLRAFLAALPRRESPALAMTEKAEAECLSWKGNAEQAWEDHANLSKELGEAVARAEKAEAELSSQLGILRPLSEMPKTVPDGYMAIFHWQDDFGAWITGPRKPTKGFFAILRLPSAEATPPAEPKSKWICPEHFRLASEHAYEAARRPTAAEATPPAEPAAEATPPVSDKEIADIQAEVANNLFGAVLPEPAARVPLGPEDCPPGSAFCPPHWAGAPWIMSSKVCIDDCLIDGKSYTWKVLMNDGWQINTSLPDTGRWDATAWRPCSKPGK